MNISDLYPEIRQFAVDVPPPLMRRLVAKVAREFCKQTGAYRVENPAVTLTDVSGVYKYALTTITDDINDILSATYGGKKLTRATKQQIMEDDKDTLTEVGTPNYFFKDTVDYIGLAPTPAAGATTTFDALQISLLPARDATTLDDELMAEYQDSIIAGTLGELLMIPKKPWSDPGLAAYFKGEFEDAIDEATSRVTDGNMKGVVRKVRYGGI